MGGKPSGLYQPELMRHARTPARRGRVAAPTGEADGVNRPCGDRLVLTVEHGETVRAIRFEGEGCALCLAAASALCDAVEGLAVGDARAVGAAVIAAVRAADAPVPEPARDLPGDLAFFVAARAFPARHGCVTLAAELLGRALA